MSRTLALLAALAAPALVHAQPLQTVAEKTDYKATSRGADVVGFCEAVATRGPVARLDYFGASHEGRKLPFLVVADPPVATPEAAKASGKLVALAFANIHAGEVDGKEALLALARDLTDRPGHPLLKDLVILLVPNLNADGNEKIDPKNRLGDNGPIDGAGTRANAQGLDLNRDFVKLESPEVRALVKLVNTWDPALVIDCHTTNGSKHRFKLTYDGPRYPSDADIATWADGTLFPAVTQKVKAATGFDIAPYGNFSKDRTRWETYPATPRYSTQYFALCGRVGVLSESYSYATFKERIDATRAFVTACFEVAADKKKDLAKLVQHEKVTRVAVRTETAAFPKKLTVLGFEEAEKDGQRVPTDRHKEYALDYEGRVGPKEWAEVPFAYLVPAEETRAIENLQRHGIVAEELREDINLPTDVFSVGDFGTMGTAPNLRIVNVEGRWGTVGGRVAAGTVVVKTAQPLGALAAYLLEPKSEDGLAHWFVFSHWAVRQWYPVRRLPTAQPLALGAVAPLPEARTANQPVTEAQLMGRGGALTFGFAGTPLTTGAWLDGEHFLQVKEGKLLKVEARTGKGEPWADPEKIKTSLAAIKGVSDTTADRTAKGTSFRTSPDRAAFLFDIGEDIGLGYFDGRPGARLTKSGGRKEHVSFSPDGKRVAFVRAANLFAVSAAEPGEEKQLTTDGGGEVFNAKGDWVYEEEIFNRNGKAYWWSPDGARLAFLRFDDAPVRKFNLVDLQPAAGRLESYAYPKPGDPNPVVKIGVVGAGGGKPAFLDLDGYKPEDTVVARVGWVAKSGTVFAYVQNRTQTWLDVVTWESPAAKPVRLFRETTKAWVDDPGEPHWLADGTFLFPSERTGWKHLYHYAADGRLLAQVTKGDWEVKDVLRVDEGAGAKATVYFNAAHTSPTGVDLCRAALGAGTEVLTEKGKTHRVSLAPAGPLFVDRFSDPMTPTRADVCEIGKGAVRKLDTNPVRERDGFRFGKYERVKIELKDGFVLEGAITYPPDFDKAKKYPVWLFTYAGPHSPTLRDEWGGGRVMEQSLATTGIVTFRVDPRSASGKGAQSAWACYKQLGVQELKDLEEAVAWLAQRPYIDAKRVGISGHSYGGFMAAYALTHSKAFSAGIASGPVTDWKLYDSIYTERYMLTPKENPDGYARSSCVAAAKDLSGKLLIVHGMMDDNVHMQNSVQLADALQRAGRDFEMMLYPQARHGIGGQHYTKLQMEFIRRTMGVQK